MEIMKYDKWTKISSKKKIIYYPEFFYGVPNTSPSIIDPFYIENEVRKHLFQMKILLLYFHYINMPFGHFYAPFDRIHTNMYYTLFANTEFRKMIMNQYIFYTIRPSDDPLQYWQWIGEELHKCKFKHFLSLNDDLKYIFYDLLLIERNSAYLNRSRGTLSNVQEIVTSSKFKQEDLDTIKRSINQSLLGGHSFMHEVFVFNLQNTKYNDLHNVMANYYFKRSEMSNYNTLTYKPLGHQGYGSLLRKNTENDVYAFLYSPDFFTFFISLFLDLKETNIFKITISDIERIRSQYFWETFVDEYHKLIKHINRQLYYVTEENIIETAKQELKNEFSKGGLWDFSEHLLVELIKKTIFSPISQAFMNSSVRKDLELEHLKIEYRAIYEFIKYISIKF